MDAPDTVTEATRMLEAEGYDASVALLADGRLRFSGSGSVCDIDEAVVERMYRFEGESDPGDEMVVFGVSYPAAGVRGTLVSAFGPAADPDTMQHLSYIAARVDNP
jgi:hypothetical protein